MRIFEISVNQNMVCRAGLDGANLLTAILTSHIPDEESLTRALYLKPDECPLDLNIAGNSLDCGSIRQWPKINLKVGDQVSILIREGDIAEVD